jgi:1-acyl-sn-glycerol-3-phosphate acyltransferase
MSGTLTRDQLVTGILRFLEGEDLLPVSQIRTSLEREIDDAGADALVALREQLTADDGWSYYPPSRLAARIHHLLSDRFLQPDSRVSGEAHLQTVGSGPLMIFANHLSYADANVFQLLVHRAGYEALAQRLTALAGPKIFTSRQRRFSSLCFGTIKVPQSADVSSEEAVLNPREVARAARHAIDLAAQRIAAGDALVLFGEGRRSRTAQMQRSLPAVARYIEAAPDAWVLPVGIAGTEALFPVGDVTVRPTSVHLHVGTPMPAHRLATVCNGHRQTMMDLVGLLIAKLLPARYRGVYENALLFPEAERALRSVLSRPER